MHARTTLSFIGLLSLFNRRFFEEVIAKIALSCNNKKQDDTSLLNADKQVTKDLDKKEKNFRESGGGRVMFSVIRCNRTLLGRCILISG